MFVGKWLGFLRLAAWFVLLAPMVPAQAQDMAFRLVDVGSTGKCGDKCPQIIAAEGDIIDSTPQVFYDFIKSHASDQRLRAVMVVHSPGGNVVASLRLGFVLRQAGLAVVVARARDASGGLSAGRCYSACVYALMGGKTRIVPPESEVGVHRSFIPRYGEESKREGPDGPPQIDVVFSRKLLGEYSKRMGVGIGLVDEALRTNPNSIHILTREEIARWRLARAKL